MGEENGEIGEGGEVGEGAGRKEVQRTAPLESLGTRGLLCAVPVCAFFCV